MAKIDTLKASPFFKDLSDKEFAAIDKIIVEKKLPPGTTLYLEGMLGESMYIIASGNIKMSKMISEGQEQVLVMLGPGEHFGEMAILDGGARAASAVSTAETIVFVLRRSDFVELGASQPGVCLKVLWLLVKDFSRKIRENNDRYSNLLAQLSPGT